MLNVPAYLWAKIVKELDNNKCVVCGSKERLEAHHIKSKSEYPELSNALENGVTLCRSCHYSAHEGHFVSTSESRSSALFLLYLVWASLGIFTIPFFF